MGFAAPLLGSREKDQQYRGGSGMQVPLNVTFRNVLKNAATADLIRKQAAKLDRVCDHIVSCRIAVEKPQEHQRSGNPFRVRIDVTVPPEHEIIVTREAGEGDLHEQLPTVIRDAFAAMRRQLRKLVEKQHRNVKTHPEQELAGVVIRLFREQGYGFIKRLNGDEIYFHKNSLLGDDFDHLAIGTGVQWVEEQGDKGPQASTVRIVDKPGSSISSLEEHAIEPPLGWRE
jgi:cold shock CspA family protein/ribosome-associated translation inhibitor RaiA